MDTEYIKSIEYRTEMEAQLARDFWFMCENNKRPDYLVRNMNETWSEICFPLECGNGWLQHIYNMCRELLTEVKSDFEFAQIKEKYGTLNVYYGGTITPYGEQIIKQYEDESRYICECCGQEGKMRTDGWCMCLCDECYNKERR